MIGCEVGVNILVDFKVSLTDCFLKGAKMGKKLPPEMPIYERQKNY